MTIYHNNYKFSQSFGAENETAPVAKEDLISSLAFSEDSQLLAVGDYGGRVILFERKPGQQPMYDAISEFTGHVKDFDILRSQEISPEILQMEFLQSTQSNQYLLTATERDVKMFAIRRETVKYVPQSNQQFPKKTVAPQVQTVPRRIYNNASQFHLNSMCLSPTKDSFLISDDFSITQFWIEDHLNGFQLINNQITQLDVKLNLITTSVYHPQDGNLLFVGYSAGNMKLYDLRTNLKQTSMQSAGNGYAIQDIRINSPNLVFSRTNQHIVINDIRNLNKPLFQMNLNPKIKIQENKHSANNFNQIESYKPNIIQNEHEIKFNVSISEDQKYWATGFYGNQLMIGNLQNDVIAYKTTRILKKQKSQLNLPGSQLGSKLVVDKSEIQPQQFSDQIAGRVEKVLFGNDCLVGASGGNLFVYSWNQ